MDIETIAFLLELIKDHGVTVVLFGVISFILAIQNRKCDKELTALKQEMKGLRDNETALTKECITVISKVTGCIDRMRDTIESLKDLIKR